MRVVSVHLHPLLSGAPRQAPLRSGTKLARMSARLPPETFRLPVERLREGYYSDAYFVSTKRLLEEHERHPRALMQVFQKKRSILGGIDEAIAVLKLCSGRREDGGWAPGWHDL